ncbi:MAG TPA: hypothetical protein DIS53_03640 [Candidatus Wildermuthbacteria bacterium]|uniref:Uncharacterized protein n=1 Tax=Candidatus Yanofskybacteria bacterium GW2011_GWC1_48_11 TaxID=1619027 RepID=A0A837INZ6_9BACT|nr:MAG: hypothetical protein UY25_C0002G0031 [Candidatus Yanofskybacteria bacterium GW2011_GWC1_48_11]KKW04721.1 MAG: hypothetical protein UY38_C0001G0288 [Parcubacteria group bacterium GW2011_GWB1_49_12]KKW08979.1 MAG: hypothetical protein UY45_C0002G0031 [Parcubacteria group bacterium GW2011_GWA1_49_26]KKW14251.1 MAG: hypothetical protein UY53_C0002G0040 [Parcubacteria group bacterium GW2011_GWA2_50_10]OHA61035.1 MAG: hypothetical protein A2109_02155 [Candidatus Wildermuthbacteria bacterium G
MGTFWHKKSKVPVPTTWVVVCGAGADGGNAANSSCRWEKGKREAPVDAAPEEGAVLEALFRRGRCLNDRVLLVGPKSIEGGRRVGALCRHLWKAGVSVEEVHLPLYAISDAYGRSVGIQRRADSLLQRGRLQQGERIVWLMGAKDVSPYLAAVVAVAMERVSGKYMDISNLPGP